MNVDKYLIQHNEARYEMSALEKNIFLLLMSKLSASDPPDKKYFIDIGNYDVFNSVSINDLEKAAHKLQTRVYHIPKPNGNVLSVTLICLAIYNNLNKKMFVAISHELLPYLISIRDHFYEAAKTGRKYTSVRFMIDSNSSKKLK